MKKNELIKLLEEIKGNPEVVFWGGFVGDWMHIDKPEQHKLYKTSLEKYIIRCQFKSRYDKVQPTENALVKSYEELDWEFANKFISDDELQGFRSKNIILLQPKPRG